jgi:alpha-mannosidase
MLFLHLLFFLSSSSKVFFVPHSHIDVGWINVANYYYTEHCSKILSTVIQLLEEDPRRKFAWSESYWISEYIKEHPDSKARLKNLIDSGQIEIVGGGWVQHDEALTDFESIAKQFEHGHSFLKEEFNISSPTVAWQLDPFGHSSLTPAILEKFGFKNLVMGRIDASYKVISK